MFREKIFPVLTPLAVDSGRPFPYISNLSLNLAVLVRDPAAGRMHFARIKVPPLLPRFVPFSEGRCFTPLEDVIAANLDQLFPGMEIVEHHTFRVTRNADLEIDDRRRRPARGARGGAHHAGGASARRCASRSRSRCRSTCWSCLMTRARGWAGRRIHAAGAARPGRPLEPARDRPAGPQGRALCAGHPSGPVRGR